jgi:hypothetical protein
MEMLSHRRAIQLASSFAATTPLLSSIEARAQVKAGAGATIFEMASFTSAGVDADAAFAKALAAISKSAADASHAGRPAHIVLNLDKNAVYRIKRPLLLKQLSGFELNGNGAQLVNTTLDSTLLISSSSHITIRDLSIDYDPLPFTQGTLSGFDHAALQIMVKVDPGYPDDPAFLATITDGFFRVMDRHTRALKAGARDFLSPSRVERVGEKLIKVHLQWSANDVFPSQLPIAVGDVVALNNGYAHAIVVDNSASTTFSELRLLASPAWGYWKTPALAGWCCRKSPLFPGHGLRARRRTGWCPPTPTDRTSSPSSVPRR